MSSDRTDRVQANSRSIDVPPAARLISVVFGETHVIINPPVSAAMSDRRPRSAMDGLDLLDVE
jgi:hypothetical protein